MSKETITWLNTRTLIGNTDARCTAWHYRATEQGAEPNHYPGPIPVEDVKRRLFDWQAVPRRVAVEFPATVETMTHLNDAGEPVRWAVQADRHAGLLRGGAVAWVEVSVPETITTPEGVAFRPNLLAATSFDGSLATTLKRTVQLTVCDNTMKIALGEKGQQVKIKHSSQSLTKIGSVREALALVHTEADEFAAQVARLTQTTVTPIQLTQVIEQIFPITDPNSKRAVTNAVNRRDEIMRLYRFDPRVSDWTGTAFGVLQAFNTWRHHEQGGLAGSTNAEKRAARADRNALRAVTGETEREDAHVARVLAAVLD